MKRSFIALAVAGALTLGACAEDGPKENLGTILGGVGGAAIGSQIGGGTGTLVAVAAGTLIGSFLGRSVGRSLDRADLVAANQAQQQAHGAAIGETVVWNNPRNGHHGAVTPMRDGFDPRTGACCREYQQTVTIDGKTEQAYGMACRQPDGTWRIVS